MRNTANAGVYRTSSPKGSTQPWSRSSHLIACDESESFVERSAFFRSVKDKTIQAFCSRPFDDLSEQHLGHALSAPFRFGKYINDDTVATLGESGPTERMWQSSVQMNTGAADNNI